MRCTTTKDPEAKRRRKRKKLGKCGRLQRTEEELKRQDCGRSIYGVKIRKRKIPEFPPGMEKLSPKSVQWINANKAKFGPTAEAPESPKGKKKKKKKKKKDEIEVDINFERSDDSSSSTEW